MIKRVILNKRFEKTDYFIENHEYTQKKLINNISLLNWNIQKKNNHPIWVKEFAHLIESYTPDIVLLQECQFEKGLEQLLHIEHYGFIFAPNYIDLVNNRHSGVLTASNTHHQSVVVTHSHADEPLINIPKLFLSTTYTLANQHKQLLVINIHAINFVGFWKFISQIQQLEYTIRAHSGPIILSGDFNTWNKKRSHMLDRILASCGLYKVNFALDHAKNIKRFIFNTPLDHIYYRNLQVMSQPHALKTRSSDHNPLLVSFNIL